MAPGRRSETKILAYTKRPHILCLSETWLTPTKPTPNFIGYNTKFRKDRTNGRGGGLLTLIRDDIKCEPRALIPPQGLELEVQAFDIHLAHDKVSLLHIYNPPEYDLNQNHLNLLVRQLRRKYIIVGDLNAHHHIWNPINPPNQRGIT